MDDIISFLTVIFNIVIFFKPFFSVSPEYFYGLISPVYLMLTSLACSCLYLSATRPKIMPFLVAFFSLLAIVILLDESLSNNVSITIICLIAIVFRILDGIFIINGLESLSNLKRLYCAILSGLFFIIINTKNTHFLVNGNYKIYLLIYSVMFYFSLAGCYSIIENHIKCSHFGGISVFSLHFFASISIFYSQSNIFTLMEFDHIKINLEKVYVWSFFISLISALILKICGRRVL